MTYEPQPLDTSAVVLPADVLALTEYLARHNHDVWASGRLRAGWTYGPQRDDARRQHPGLVPYDQLSETEKDFDRTTALEALRVILAAGYRIVKDPSAQGGNR